jgi:hypothetical protein
VARNGDLIYKTKYGVIVRKDCKTGRKITIPEEELQRLGTKTPEYHPDLHTQVDEFIKIEKK